MQTKRGYKMGHMSSSVSSVMQILLLPSVLIVRERLLIKCGFYSISVRPLRLHFVNEDARNATQEIRRLESERDNIQTHLPEQLRNSNIQVEFNGIFSMCDGKVINLMWDNRCQATCPFCLRTARKMMTENIPHPTIIERIMNFQVIQLHGLLR